MQVDQQRKPSSDPIVILLADGHVHQSLLGVQLADLGLLAVEGQVFEHQRDALTRLQEECIVLTNQVISFWLCVVAV